MGANISEEAAAFVFFRNDWNGVFRRKVGAHLRK
jgi:hypothetical protein